LPSWMAENPCFEDHLGVHLVQTEIHLVRRYALQICLGSA